MWHKFLGHVKTAAGFSTKMSCQQCSPTCPKWLSIITHIKQSLVCAGAQKQDFLQISNIHQFLFTRLLSPQWPRKTWLASFASSQKDSLKTNRDYFFLQSDSHQFLERLARQYAEDLNTHTQDVFLRLLELQESPLDSNGHESSVSYNPGFQCPCNAYFFSFITLVLLYLAVGVAFVFICEFCLVTMQ